jgi:hypothetical protein
MIEKRIWIITDLKHKVIACGTKGRRRVKLIENCDSRILTYASKAKAEAGIKISDFQDLTTPTGDSSYKHNAPTYLDTTYGRPTIKKAYWDDEEYMVYHWDYRDILTPIPATITIDF